VSVWVRLAGGKGGGILDLVLPLCDLEAVRDAAQVTGAIVASDFPAYATGAYLVWDRCVGLKREFDSAALATAV
jgi:hypothetical protein